MDNTFEERSQAGELFAVAIFDFLRNHTDGMIRHVVHSGAEHLFRELLEDLRRDNQPMARRLRYNPDGTIYLRGAGFRHLEAKASADIERAPYEAYMRYEDADEPVFLVFAPKLLKNSYASVYIGRLRDITLHHGQQTVSAFEPDRRFPVDEDGWIVQRRIVNGSRYGSGTPYREIDIPNSGVLRFASARLISGNISIEPNLVAGDTVERADRGRPHPTRHRDQRDVYLRAVRNWIAAYKPSREDIKIEASLVASVFQKIISEMQQ